jgi:hypothetical protein
MVAMPAVAAVGAGLLFTANTSTSTAKMIGYQIIYGFGIGTSCILCLLSEILVVS